MAGPIRIALLANGRQARAEINRTAGSLGVIGRGASRAGKLIAGAFAVGSIIRVGKALEDVGGSYVKSLNKIQALTGATDTQMGRLATKLESQSSAFAKFGQTTGDAAEGIVELAKSGLSAQKSLAAIRGTMTLAKAGELDVADASALVANTLNTFNLKASKAADIANSLANAANISSADVRDVAESFKYVAPLAAKAGFSVDQTNAALAELANSGIKASQAGTTMRGMLVALQAPSTAGGMWLDELGVKVYGAGGKMRDFGAILEDLRTGLAKVSDEDANFALKSIFGRNSITGASVLIKGGVDELDRYTEGVKRAGAATKLAESASKGLPGTFASIKANAESAAQEFYRRYSPAVDEALRGTIDKLGEVGRAVKDAFETHGGAQRGGFLGGLANQEREHLASIKATWDGLKRGWTGLLDSISRIGEEHAGMFHVLFDGASRIRRDIGPSVAWLGEHALKGLGKYLEFAADGVKFWGNTVLTVARVVVGAFGNMVNVVTDSASFIIDHFLNIAEAGAKLHIPGMGSIADDLRGMRDSVSTAGNEFKAKTDGIVAGLKETQWEFNLTATQAKQLDNAIRLLPDEVETVLKTKGAGDSFLEVQRLQQVYDLTTDEVVTVMRAAGTRLARRDAMQLARTYDLTPEQVATVFATSGGSVSRKEARALQRQYHLTPAKLRTVFATAGVKGVVVDARRAKDALKDTGKVKPDFGPARQATNKFASEITAKARQGAGRASEALRDGTSKARPNLAPFTNKFAGDVNGLKGTASSGGRGIGSSLGSGIYSGVGAWAGPIASRAAAIVRAAVASAKAAGKIHSPSRVMRDEVGAMLGEGLVAGLRAKEKAGEHSGKSFMGKVLRGVANGSEGISKVLDKITHLIESKLDGKKQAGRRKALLKSLKDERAALVANGKAQDRNARALDKAIDQYKALKQRADEFARSIKSGFQSYGSIVGLGTVGGGTAVTLPAILSQLQARSTIAQQFASVIESLRGKLNKTSLRQLLEQAAGGDLEGALATAQAVAGGGAAAIQQINQLTQQIAQAGADLAEKMRKKFFGHGLQVAEGVVEGLKRREKKLDKVADRLAQQFVHKAQQGLHITATPGVVSPSQTHNRTATPALDTYMSSRASTATAASVRVTLSAEQVSQLQRGREIQADLDVYHGAGGRAKARTK